MSVKNSINAQIFYALEISEESKVPFLFMSAPGMGKSTTVFWYAQQKGYELEVLRGNSTSEDEIMGYDVVDDKNPDAESARHLIPDWFSHVKENAKQGKKTLLFIDEITTCTDQVQSALLHLIFERKVHDQPLPEDTLIVSAGNYSQCLGSTFGLIPPLMNRFCIYNIIPNRDDVASFLSRYSKRRRAQVDPKKLLADMTKASRAASMTDSIREKLGEYIEDTVYTTYDHLVQNKELDIKVTDTQNVYSDVKGDDPLRGFVSPRTLCYYCDAAIATYIRFGKDGLKSDNFLKITQGLVGYGFTRDSGKANDEDISTHNLEQKFFKAIKDLIPQLDKLGNSKVEEYEQFFKTTALSNGSDANAAAKLSYPDIKLVSNKIKAVLTDSEVSSLSKPIDESLLQSLIELLNSKITLYTSDTQKLISKNAEFKTIGTKKEPLTRSSHELLVSEVVNWNTLAEFYEAIVELVKHNSDYSDNIRSEIKRLPVSLARCSSTLKVIYTNIKTRNQFNAVAGELIPEFKNEILENKL